ncbi:MAG: peptidyl-alpha-hydroxyglycine alpha-amidating lyase family protein [Alphaproteobacteria bacterium]
MAETAGGKTNGIVGYGGYAYRVQEDWAKLPAGWVFKDVAAVAVDSQDRVYVFNRGEHPMMVFDRDGNLLNSWGENLFHRAHGLHIGPDQALYCTDDGDHTVRKCTLGGKVLLELGIPGRPSGFMSGEPFNRCTHTALSPDLDIYVSDGYANARIHKFAPNGKLLFSWGECGADPGQFNIPHNIVTDPEGWVYVADRENHRVQIFDGNGRYETQWNNLHRPCGLYMTGGEHGCCYIGELGPHQPVNRNFPNLGPRLSILSRDGRLVSRVDGKSGLAPTQLSAPHGLAVDSRGDIYVGEVSWTAWQNYTNPGQPVPPTLRSLQKLVRVPQ